MLRKQNPSVRLGMEMSPLSQYSTISPAVPLILLKIERERKGEEMLDDIVLSAQFCEKLINYE